MLVEDEGELVVKVIDFGLAKSAKETTDDSAALTMQGFIGTPHFASPEQVEEGEVDVRSDIYSLGATLYFMLTGKAPEIPAEPYLPARYAQANSFVSAREEQTCNGGA